MDFLSIDCKTRESLFYNACILKIEVYDKMEIFVIFSKTTLGGFQSLTNYVKCFK